MSKNIKIGKENKLNFKQSVALNDITNEEFDSYYLRCLENKNKRENSNFNYEFDDDTYDYEPTNEEIDAAFEEAEKWSDF